MWLVATILDSANVESGLFLGGFLNLSLKSASKRSQTKEISDVMDLPLQSYLCCVATYGNSFFLSIPL